MPLDSGNKTMLEEVAWPVWPLGADGEVAGVSGNPLYVTGTVDITEEGEEFERDETTNALTVIEEAHHEIHKGHTFITSYKTPDAAPIADNATLAFAVTVAAREAHIIVQGACGGDMEGELYEGTTWTGGTAQPIFNKKRNSGYPQTVGVVRDPTVTLAGTLLENEFIPGGTGPNAVGGASRHRAEWVLAPARTYLFRITNRSGSNQPASLALEWYEEEV